MSKKAKIITICGSLRFQDKMKWEAEALELAGNCVLSVVYPANFTISYTEEQLDWFGRSHKMKIDLSDAIYVVNMGGYIGNSTREEILYAKKMGKEILSLEPIVIEELV